MKRQRNNLAALEFPIREVACKMIFDGAKYGKIRDAIEKLAPGVKIHNSTLLAYQASAEYKEYVERRRQWEDKLSKRRWAAGIINDGKGPQSLADLAEVAILEQLHDLAASPMETGKDVANVARAITAMQRTQLARADSAKESEISNLKSAYEAEITAKNAEIAEMKAENTRLAGMLQAAGIDPAAGAKKAGDGLSPAALRQIEEKAKLL